MEQITIVITETAYADLEDIESYISLDSPTIARRFISKIFDKITQLQIFPISGKIVREFNDLSIRELLLDRYRIVYKVDSETQITVLRVIHGARLLSSEF